MKNMIQQRVFLSGRIESNWQDRVKAAIPSLEYFDPRDHGLQDPVQYITWDMHHIRIADVVFAYMEKDNPSGYGLATEVGYGKASGKTIILVDERSAVDDKFREYFITVRALSDITFDSLEDGISLLKQFVLRT